MKHGDIRYLQVQVVSIGSSTNGVPHWVEVTCDIAPGAPGVQARICVPTSRLVEPRLEHADPVHVTGRVRELIHTPGPAPHHASIVVGGVLLSQEEQKAVMDALAKGHRVEIVL